MGLLCMMLVLFNTLVTSSVEVSSCPEDNISCDLKYIEERKGLQLNIAVKDHGMKNGLASKLGQAEVSETDLKFFEALSGIKEAKASMFGRQGALVSVPSNIEVIGLGYDIYTGSQIPSGGTGYKQRMIDLPYKQVKLSQGGEFLLPDNVHMVPHTSDNAHSTAVWEIYSATDYHRMECSLTQREGVCDGGQNSEARWVQTQLHPGHVVLYVINATSQFSASLSQQKNYINEVFKDELASLAPDCDLSGKRAAQQYVNFIKQYGIHYVQRVTMGTLSIHTIVMDKMKWLKLKAKRITASTIASVVEETTILSYGLTEEIKEAVRSLTYRSPGGDSAKPQPIQIKLGGLLDVVDILRKKVGEGIYNCMKRNVDVYCLTLPTGRCHTTQYNEEENYITYGDTVTLRNQDGDKLYVTFDWKYISGYKGSSLSVGNPNEASQAEFQILPLEGREHLLGERIMSGDSFLLSQHAMDVVLLQTADYYETGANQFVSYPTDMQHRNTKPKITVMDTKETFSKLSLSLGEFGNASSVGPLLLTVSDTTHTVSYRLDPCQDMCHERMTYTTYLPPRYRMTDIQTISIQVLAEWSDPEVRDGRISLQYMVITGGAFRKLYKGGATHPPALICPSCSLITYSIHDGSLVTTHLVPPGVISRNGQVQDDVLAPVALPFTMESSTSFILGDNSHMISMRPVISETTGANIQVQKDCDSVLYVFSNVDKKSTRMYTDSISKQDIFIIYLQKIQQISVIKFPTTNFSVENIEIKYFDHNALDWSGVLMLHEMKNTANAFSIKNHSVTTMKLMIVYKDVTSRKLNLSGMTVYGCENNSYEKDISLFTSSKWTITRKSNVDQKSVEIYSIPEPDLVVDNLVFTYITESNVTCDLDNDLLANRLGELINADQSELEVLNVSVASDFNDGLMLMIHVKLTAEKSRVAALKTQLTQHSESGGFNLPCVAISANRKEEVNSLEDDISQVRLVLIIVGVILLVILVTCLIVFIFYLRLMSVRYRDINNELTTMRKMKISKRIAKREEYHRSVSEQCQGDSHKSTTAPPVVQNTDKAHSNHQGALQRQVSNEINTETPNVLKPEEKKGFTLPDRKANICNNPQPIQTSTVTPGKVAPPSHQMVALVTPARSLRHTQSLHGHNERPASYRPMETISSIDPADYIISNPYRAPSRHSGTTGDESDTVQSIC